MNNAIDTIKEMSLDKSEILFQIDSANRVRVWGCWASTNSEGAWGIYYTDGIIDGKVKTPTFKASAEKNIGKANFMSCQMQAYAMATQEVGKKLKDNYFNTPEEAKENKSFRPMLCPSGMKWKDYSRGGKNMSKVIWPILASPKLDGARANMGACDNTFKMLTNGSSTVSNNYPIRTREGRSWLNFKHVQDDIYFQKFFEDHPNIILDGEMYNHTHKDDFEELMSIFRKEKPTAEQRELSARVSKYYVYDIYVKDRPNLSAFQRQQLLISFYEKYFKECELFAPLFSKAIHNEEQFNIFHNECMDQGYEGSIIRLIDASYGVDSRSGELLKRKDVFDCEFIITDVFEGEGSKAGLAGGVVISLMTPGGMNAEDFSKLNIRENQKAGLARGWDDNKARELWENKENYINQVGTIEYFGITGHGKLRFPKFKALRHD